MKDTILYKIMAICVAFVSGVIMLISLVLISVWYILLNKLRPDKGDEQIESFNKITDAIIDRYVRFIRIFMNC